MPTLNDLAKTLEAKRGELAKIFTDHQEDGGQFKAVSPETVQAIREREDELGTIQAEYTALKSFSDAAAKNSEALALLKAPQRGFEFGHPKGGPEETGTAPFKSLGETFVESAAFKARHEAGQLDVKMGDWVVEAKSAAIKTLMTTTAGFAPFVPRDNTLIYTAQRQPVVADLIPATDTQIPGIRYIEETLFTNGAAAVLEGGVKPESALQLTERLLAMSKVATSLPVTEEQLADVPGIRDYIDNRLRLQLMFEEERELLQGSGAGGEMVGFLNKTGVQTLAKGAVDSFTAVLTLITQIENTIGFANVSGIIAHPTDFLGIRTIKDSTGRFIMGAPDAPGPATLWGKPVVKTIAEPQGTMLMGDFQTYAHIYRREGITFRVGYVNDQFIRNIMTILCEFRELLAIFRASAFGTLVSGSFTS